jgi:hypothetical protein
MRRVGFAVGLLVPVSLVVGRGAPPPPSALPGPTVPEGLGVNIHFTDPRPGEMAQLAPPKTRLRRPPPLGDV